MLYLPETKSRFKNGDFMKVYCCEDMRYFATYKCKQHDNPYECEDNLLVYDKRRRQYGLIIHDSYSYVVINHCPWCGSALYKRRHDVNRMLDFGALDEFGEDDED